MKILVAGAGGFIGGHLTRDLAGQGHEVVAVDRKDLADWSQRTSGVHDVVMDLSHEEACLALFKSNGSRGFDRVYMLAADMGGMGFIESHKLDCMLSVLPSTNMLLAAARAGVPRFFFSSSACVYAAGKQTDPNVTALREEDAYPADAEDGYGWEKLFTERMCRHVFEDLGMETRVARYHNVYGPIGTYVGGREKAPAAICRKVAEAVIHGRKHIDIWGDGEQTRSFMHVDDCAKGTQAIMESGWPHPVNLGSDYLVSINELVTIVEDIAGVRLERRYDLTAPQGVRGRNSDNTMLRSMIGFEPSTSLRDGLTDTYRWIYDQLIYNQLTQGATS